MKVIENEVEKRIGNAYLQQQIDFLARNMLRSLNEERVGFNT